MVTLAASALLSIGVVAAGTASVTLPPVANFTEVKSTINERTGSVELAVAFTQKFFGNLSYCFEGTAEQGADYVSNSECRFHKVASASGEGTDRTTIVIDLRDDVHVEPVETIHVNLRSGIGYEVGVRDRHVVSIRDNDLNWRVMHDVDGMRFDYRIRILRRDDNTTATAWSDGFNGLPAGIYPVKLIANDQRFEAIIGPIATTADQSLLGAGLSRTFTLVANRPENGSPIDYHRPLLGTATETWASPEGAAYLSRRNPIRGRFLMSQMAAHMGPPDTHTRSLSSETTSHHLGGAEEIGPACESDGVGRFTVQTSTLQHYPNVAQNDLFGWTDGSQVSGSFGQPFAVNTPYANFVDDTLSRVQSDLYFDKAPTQAAKDVAAFRYKVLLYEKENVDAETYLRAQFDKIEEHWNCAARRRAHQAAQSLVGALQYVPWNRELRWALLDIYHDIAVADKAVARQRHAAFIESMLKEPIPGESLIHQEISHLEQAMVLYRHALASYMQLLHRSFGISVADFESNQEPRHAPFGYHMFRAEVPFRSPLSTSPYDTVGERRDDPIAAGYKDAILLFEILSEYLQAAAQLSKRYILRGYQSDSKRAERLIGSALLATWLEGNALLAILPEIGEPAAVPSPLSGVREAVAGWRQSYSALGQIRSFLRGDANILGFTDDTLVLTQSTISGDPKTQFFNTYDFLSQYMRDVSSPLQRAIMDLREARRDYDNFQHRSDELAQQLSARNEQYDNRLREIVGVRPGEAGYARPADNEGSLLRQKLLSIQSARLRIERNRQRIENLEEAVRTEITRRGQEKAINDAISNVYVDFGGKQVELTRKIAEIREDQMKSSNKASMLGSWLGAAAGILLAPATGGASLLLTAGSAASFISGGISASEQAGTEIEMGESQALKERYAAQERAQVHALQDNLLDAHSQARVENVAFGHVGASYRLSRSSHRLDTGDGTARGPLLGEGGAGTSESGEP